MIYYAPSSLAEFSQYCQTHDSISILAGGSDILPRWQDNPSLKPEVLIDIKKIDELSGIHESDSEIRIGSLVTVQDVKKSKLIQSKYRALYEAACQFAGVQIRHRATVVGNICNASPAGDLLPGLFVHNARVELFGPNGKTTVPIQEFITGVGKISLGKEEIVTAIILPKSDELSLFYKLGLRQSMAISVINFAIAYEMDDNDNWKSLKIAAGAVAPTIVYLNAFTDALLNGNDLEKSIQLIDDDISPIDDIRASANYRSNALKNVIRYTIRQIINKTR